MVHPEWQDYGTNLWASFWHTYFGPIDARARVTWRNCMANFHQVRVFNFYSSGEEVLREHAGTPPTVTAAAYNQAVMAQLLDVSPTGLNVWALQEKMKGRTSGNWILGSNHGGWRFNSGYDTNAPSGHLSPQEAALLDSTQLRTNAFFDMSTDTAMFAANGGGHALVNRHRILSDAIPATTLPIGANPVERLTPVIGDDRNFDMNITFKNGWPDIRTRGNDPNQWHHSDVREVAYSFIHPLFTEFVNQAQLR